jgi:hypothetical protein
MKNFSFYILLSLLFIACTPKEPIQIIPELDHIALDEILNSLPFDKFNEYSKAVFNNGKEKLRVFALTIDEDVLVISKDGELITINQITFGYRTNFSFEISDMEVIATIDSLPSRGYTELLKCRAFMPFSSVINDNLTIIPGETYQNTVLNEEFTWLGETFENVYSNVLIEENSNDNVKLYYQASIGIIGFVDNLGEQWLFDHFE